MQTPFFRWFRAALLALPLAAGCGNDPTNAFDPSRDLKLRIVHASAAPGGSAEFLFDGQRVTQLGYGQNTPYLQVTGGSHTIGMRGAPDQDGNPGPMLFSTTVSLTAGQFQTVVVTGTGSEITAITITDQSTAATGNWQIRVMHAGQSTPALDLYVTAPGADLNAATPLVTGINWRDVTDYQLIGVGSYQIRLTPTGTKTALISSSDQGLAFQDGQVSSLLVLDNPTSGAPPAGFLLPDGGVLVQ